MRSQMKLIQKNNRTRYGDAVDGHSELVVVNFRQLRLALGRRHVFAFPPESVAGAVLEVHVAVLVLHQHVACNRL